MFVPVLTLATGNLISCLDSPAPQSMSQVNLASSALARPIVDRLESSRVDTRNIKLIHCCVRKSGGRFAGNALPKPPGKSSEARAYTRDHLHNLPFQA